jgi:hypothetical protein
VVAAHEQRVHRGRVEHVACELQFSGNVRAHLEASRISTFAERSVAVIGRAGSEEIFQLHAPKDHAGDDPLTAQAKALAAALRRQPSRIADIHDALNVQRLLSQLKQSLSRVPASAVVLDVA